MLSLRRHIRHLRTREHFSNHSSWLTYVYAYARTRKPFNRIQARGPVVDLTMRSLGRPVKVRLGTTDALVAREMFIDDVYRCVWENDIGPVRNIVDLGANIGLSLVLWDAHFPSSRVLAVEADPGNAALCEVNASAFGMGDRVQVLNACVGALRGQMYFDMSGGAWGYRLTDQPGKGRVPIDVEPLHDVLQRHVPSGDIDLVKCDIEGAEVDILRNCGPWIPRVRNMLIELHDGYGVDDLRRDLENGGANMEIDHVAGGAQPVLWCRRAAI